MIKSIYEEEPENKTSASNESLVAEPEESLLETANKLDAVLGTDGSHNEILYGENGLVTNGEENAIIPVKQGSAIAPPADDYSQYDQITGGALKVRSFFFVNRLDHYATSFLTIPRFWRMIVSCLLER